jgi:uncharacterized membrane protein YhaH (DUF805 family)
MPAVQNKRSDGRTMPDLKELFFGFSGRISRKSWWLGTVVVAVGSVVGTLLIDPGVLDFQRLGPRIPNWSDTIWQLALVIPGTALMVKRFNDRDRPYWLGYAYGIAGALITAGPHFGLFGPERTSTVGAAFAIILALAFLIAFIDNGFLRGSRGPNRYGPDPLDETAP